MGSDDRSCVTGMIPGAKDSCTHFAVPNTPGPNVKWSIYRGFQVLCVFWESVFLCSHCTKLYHIISHHLHTNTPKVNVIEPSMDLCVMRLGVRMLECPNSEIYLLPKSVLPT